MTDTVTRLLAIADVYADRFHEARKRHTAETAHDRSAARQLLEAELTRLFTPLSDEQIKSMYHVLCNSVGSSYQTVARATEQAHGIAGDGKRCPLCNYQHGHQIGCENNPVDIALKHGIGGES